MTERQQQILAYLPLYPRGSSASQIATATDSSAQAVHVVLRQLEKNGQAHSVRGAPIRWFAGPRVQPAAAPDPGPAPIAHPLEARGPGRCCTYYPLPGPGRAQRRTSVLCSLCADKEECGK